MYICQGVNSWGLIPSLWASDLLSLNLSVFTQTMGIITIPASSFFEERNGKEMGTAWEFRGSLEGIFLQGKGPWAASYTCSTNPTGVFPGLFLANSSSL